MPHLVLTEEQARTVTGALESVGVRDPEGRALAFLQRLDPHEVEAILRLWRRRASAIPSARVQALLGKLEETDRREGITQEQTEEVLRRLPAGEEL